MESQAFIKNQTEELKKIDDLLPELTDDIIDNEILRQLCDGNVTSNCSKKQHPLVKAY
jgi:hypothetical protein